MVTFVPVFSVFSVILVAFAISFYILWHQVSTIFKKLLNFMIFQDLNKNTQNNEQDFFDSPYTTIVKTFAMFVGELDFEDIPINPAKTFSVVSYAFFLIFVLMMVVILMNLLNGLAVADVGEIVRDAKVVSIKSRWQH